jgi:uncharacterized protein (DUF488 family)
MTQDNSLLVFTIGHSSHAKDRFIELVGQHGIEEIIDTRTTPRSGYAPHFNAEPLSAILESAGVDYEFMGGPLGGKPHSTQFYDDDGFVLYGKIAATPEFENAIETLISKAKRKTIAVMCGEEDPTSCHRRLLVGRVLGDHGASVIHIRGDGSTVSEADLVKSESPPSPQIAMFESDEEDEWKSTQSDSQRKRHPSSSAH